MNIHVQIIYFLMQNNHFLSILWSITIWWYPNILLRYIKVPSIYKWRQLKYDFHLKKIIGWKCFVVSFVSSVHQLQLRPKSVNHDLDLSILMKKKFIRTYIHFNYFLFVRPYLLEIYRLTFVEFIICYRLFSTLTLYWCCFMLMG